MKKIVILMVFALALPAFASIDVNLKYGQKSPEVFELQDYLIDRGFLGGSSTGYFGLLTLKAVKAYQASVNLPSTGYVGIMTRTQINKALAEDITASNAAEIAETGTTTPVSPTMAVVDMCSNIEGIQSKVPDGMFMNGDKVCFTPQVSTPVNTPVQTVPVQQENLRDILIETQISSSGDPSLKILNVDATVLEINGMSTRSYPTYFEIEGKGKESVNGGSDLNKPANRRNYFSRSYALAPGTYKLNVETPALSLVRSVDIEVK